ncbi:MAG: 16S rRNA (cytosine(1402)-N(4))-methyltransferase RsmH [Hyphomicrobium sp.]
MAGRHIPVLISEVLEQLAPVPGETYIDATFGAGGYSRALLEATDCKVLALDRDPHAVRDAAALCAQFPGRLTVVEAPFSRLEDVARGSLSSDAEPGRPSVFTPPDGIVFDIGVSSMQLDEAERGFSFQRDGPLDMRMSQSGESAADIVNTLGEKPLADLIYEFGEERRSRAIARAILARRAERRFTTTLDLADVVMRAYRGQREEGRHPATRTFQALRMHVNDELGELRRGLEAAERLLKPGGRLVVVTFHSLEDRIVKTFLADRAGRAPRGSRYLPETIKLSSPSFRIVNLRPLTPCQGELDVNPRARSARLRAAVRTEAPAQS